MTSALIAVVGLLVLARVSLALGRRAAERSAEAGRGADVGHGSPAGRVGGAAGRRLRRALQPAPPALPEGHRPPAGLSPLSPSERFLSSEAARGLRELQLFLLDPA